MTERMNPEVKAEWVAALRSGDYTQDSESSLLHSDEGYCCLGVLCDIAVKKGVTFAHDRSGRWDYGISSDPANDVLASAYLPGEVIQWAGLDGSNPVVGHYVGTNGSLASINDTGTPFEKIADIIEERL